MRKLQMINDLNNPWENMSESSSRRISPDNKYNFFWITDLKGNYGFQLHCDRKFKDVGISPNLRGVAIIKRNNRDERGELYLILNSKEDWQLFLTLCNDLVNISAKCESEERLLKEMDKRLIQWQQFLRQNNNQLMPLERQMGLFAELLCLKDLISKTQSIAKAIVSWVGPDFNKQDFALSNAFIEVKSYQTSKGPNIKITSVNQLHSEKEPLFLLAIGLTITQNGESIEDSITRLRSEIENSSVDYLDLFENKLLDYGYFPGLSQNPLYKFTVDVKRTFLVSQNFPKISPENVKHQIVSVKYVIDLSKCSEYEVAFDSITI